MNYGARSKFSSYVDGRVGHLGQEVVGVVETLEQVLDGGRAVDKLVVADEDRPSRLVQLVNLLVELLCSAFKALLVQPVIGRVQILHKHLSLGLCGITRVSSISFDSNRS